MRCRDYNDLCLNKALRAWLRGFCQPNEIKTGYEGVGEKKKKKKRKEEEEEK